MYEWELGGERCSNQAVEGSEFCEDCVKLTLCKASGIEHLDGGNSGGWSRWTITIYPHPVDDFGPTAPTKRKQFCSDRCRNLWRDTKQSRERAEAIEVIKSGERSERYALINNYSNGGTTVVLDKKTSRIVGRVEL